MEEVVVPSMDPESLFLATKQETGNEWELFKENVRPLKRGRNVGLLNKGLKSHTDNQLMKSLLEERRRMIEVVDEYEGDDPLKPWIECIKWVQESFPHGGDSSGLVVIYEQCVRTFWNSEHYKDNLRYLKVWLEYAQHCGDAEVIYSFLEANGIGQKHSVYYISYALHMESKNKMKYANDIFNRGISRNAQPLEKLNDAFRKFFGRTLRKPQVNEEEPLESRLPVRSFGTVIAKGESGRHTMESFDFSKNKLNQERSRATSLSIFKDTDFGAHLDHQSDTSKTNLNSWHTLGARAERNKENNAIPSKWASYKIPQKPGSRARAGGATVGTCIEVFVDEECSETHKVGGGGKGEKSTILQLREGDGRDLNRETELLRENPLRNFPSTSLPR